MYQRGAVPLAACRFETFEVAPNMRVGYRPPEGAWAALEMTARELVRYGSDTAAVGGWCREMRMLAVSVLPLAPLGFFLPPHLQAPSGWQGLGQTPGGPSIRQLSVGSYQ